MLDGYRTENMRKKILDKIHKSLSFITGMTLSFIGIAFAAIIIWSFFLLPYYNEYQFMKKCQDEGQTKEWCTSVWQELRTLD